VSIELIVEDKKFSSDRQDITGIGSQCGQDFPHMPRPVLEPIQSPVQ